MERGGCQNRSHPAQRDGKSPSTTALKTRRRNGRLTVRSTRTSWWPAYIQANQLFPKMPALPSRRPAAFTLAHHFVHRHGPGHRGVE